MQIHGSCHCRNIVFRLDWQPEPAEIPARACSCTFCVKHGGVWTSCPGGRLELTIAEPAKVSRYAFATRTATFHICTVCGVVPVVTSDIDGHTYAVVNVNTFENRDTLRLNRSPVSFEGEDEGDRLRRRVKGWIADVRFN